MEFPAIDSLDENLFRALEKLSQIWRNRLGQAVFSEDLSLVQGQILIFISQHSPQRNRVGKIAQEFGLTTATISEAVAALTRKGLLNKTVDPQDKRVHQLRLTSEGALVVNRLLSWAREIKAEIKAGDFRQKKETFSFLLSLIARLRRNGVVAAVRMCWFCQHFHPDYFPRVHRPHYCVLLARAIGLADIRLDCPRFVASAQLSRNRNNLVSAE